MARTRSFVLFVAVLLVLSGCSAFFGFNAFASLDKPAAPNPNRYQGVGGLANLQSDLSSPAIVNVLKNDPTTVAAINAILMGYLSGGVSTPDQQQAAILISDLNIQTTSAGGLVKNIVQTVVNGISATSKIQDLLASVIPPEARADPTVFAAMINALLLANDQYLLLGASIKDLNSNGVIDQGEGVPLGTNMGDVAQKAGVAWTIAVIDNQILGKVPAGQEITQMYLLATNPSAADPAVQNISPDPYNTSSADPYVTGGPAPSNLRKIQNIYDCAGIALPS